MVRKRKRMRRGERPQLPSRANERWSMDLTSDQLGDGRRFRTFTVVDDFTRECLAIEVSRSLIGSHLAEVLDSVGKRRGYPEAMSATTDRSSSATPWNNGHTTGAWPSLHLARQARPELVCRELQR